MKQVTIVGAGFSGLTLARALLKKNVRVVILEKSERSGGMIATKETPHGLVELAAPSFTRTDRVDAFLRDLGLQQQIPSKDSKKRLFFTGRLKSWPLSIWQTIQLATSFLITRFTTGLKPRSGETLNEWGRRCLTPAATDSLLAPALQGIYAGDAKRLSASLLLGNMFRKDRERFHGVASVPGGMGKMIEALEAQVRNLGAEFQFNHSLTSHRLPRPLVLAVPPWEAASLLQTEEETLSKRIGLIQRSPLITATAFFNQPTGPKAFGCLVPRGRGLRVLGVLLNHAIFPKRDRLFSETWIFGGATDPEIMKLTDQGLTALLAEERKTIFQKSDAPAEVFIKRWPEGLPHYDLILEDVLSDLPKAKDIWLHGNWLGGIGLSKILERSDRLADQIAAEL